MHPRAFVLGLSLMGGIISFAQPPARVLAYAVGNWRNGPVVTITPLFETNEAFTTPQLIARVKQEHAAFRTIDDIDILRFATEEEGLDSRTTLKRKYLSRGLEVQMLEDTPAKAP